MDWIEEIEAQPQYQRNFVEALGPVLLLVLHRRGKDYATRWAETVLRLYERCESPIETEMVSLLATIEVIEGWSVEPQCEVPEVGRVDFVLRHPEARQPIALECDGHNFHERTKQQAARDRGRDRRLQSAGYFVYRLTGHEIVSDLPKVNKELHGLTQSMLRKDAPVG